MTIDAVVPVQNRRAFRPNSRTLAAHTREDSKS
jgi:hypothetical protein